MKEIANLTDFLLFIECAIFAAILFPQEHLRIWSYFFAAASLAALGGGITHTFFEAPGTTPHLISWDFTLLAIGVTGIFLAKLALPKIAKLNYVLIFVAVAYSIYVLTALRTFLTAIALYLPASLLLTVSLIRNYFKTRDSSTLFGIFGMLLTFVAAAIQQANINIPELLLNYNAIYHIIQGVGLFLLFLHARKIKSS